MLAFARQGMHSRLQCGFVSTVASENLEVDRISDDLGKVDAGLQITPFGRVTEKLKAHKFREKRALVGNGVG